MLQITENQREGETFYTVLIILEFPLTKRFSSVDNSAGKETRLADARINTLCSLFLLAVTLYRRRPGKANIVVVSTLDLYSPILTDKIHS